MFIYIIFVDFDCSFSLISCLDDNIQGGAYYSNCVEKTTEGKDGIANDKDAWKRLWDLSQSQLESVAALKQEENGQ
jgi:hypothetical protein